MPRTAVEMELAEFDEQVAVFRARFSAALSEEAFEDRSGGPFGNQFHRFSFSRVVLSVVLDRGDFRILIEANTDPEAYFSFEYLLTMLFPDRSDVLTITEDEIRAVTSWLAAAAKSTAKGCLRVAYNRFENCMNMKQLGL